MTRYECRLGLITLLQQGHPGLGKLFMVLRVFTQVKMFSRSTKMVKQTIMRLKTLLSTEAGKLVPGARPQIAGTPPRAGEQRKWQNLGGNASFGER